MEELVEIGRVLDEVGHRIGSLRQEAVLEVAAAVEPWSSMTVGRHARGKAERDALLVLAQRDRLDLDLEVRMLRLHALATCS